MTTTLLPQYLIETLGWTLIHWLWQGLAVAVILAAVLKAFTKVSSSRRYLIACVGLAAMVVMPLLTFKVLSSHWQSPVEFASAEHIQSNIGELKTIQMPLVLDNGVSDEPTTLPVVGVSLKQRFCSAVETNSPVIVYGWLIGVFGFSLWHLGGWRQLQKLRRTMVKPVSKVFVDKMNDLAETIGVKKTVSLMESALVQGPIVVGWFKPMILLPASALTGLSVEQIKAILAHELAHVKRCDYLVNIIQTAIEIVGFYNPSIWWVSAKIRAERENSCDDIAVALIGDKVSYAKTLTTMEELRCGYKLAVAGSGASLFDRVKRLLSKDRDTCGEKSLLTAAIAVLLLAMVAIPAGFAMNSKAEVKADSISKSDNNDYKVTLDSGITVELAGLCAYDNQGFFWKPDGSMVESNLRVTTKAEIEGQARKAFFFKFNTNDFNLKFSCDGSDSSSATYPKTITDKSLKDHWVVVPGIDKDIKKTNLRIGIAAGQWQVISESDGNKRLSGPRDVVFTHPIETKNGTAISVRGEWDFEGVRRIVAIDKKGKLYNGNWDGRSSNNHTIAMGNFSRIRPHEIEKYQVQFRHYEWVEFKNVSLKPDNKTDVQITVEKANKPLVIKDSEQKRRHFVTVVAGSDVGKIRYQGQQITWEELKDKLSELPQKEITVLETAYEPGIFPGRRNRDIRNQWFENNVFKKAKPIVNELGLEYLSFVGQDNPNVRRGPISIRTEGRFKLNKEIPVGLQSFEDEPLLNLKSVVFDRNLRATIKLSAMSYPQKFWEIVIRLLDEQGNQIKLVAKTYDNKGMALGRALNYVDEIEFRVDRTDIKAIDRFEIQLREFLKPENRTDVQGENIRVYKVNKKVLDFPEAEDFSTPESAYAAINRVMAAEDHQGWQRVSTKKIAERLAKWSPKIDNKTYPQWSKVVLNANILEVRIKDNQAVVIAQFPQELSSKPIKEPIDYRHLIFEDGKWLNTGENRYDTIEQAREKFDKMLEKRSAEDAEQLKIEQKYTEAIEKPDMLLNLTKELFEKIRKADYDEILSYYDKQTGKWKRDGWKKLGLNYTVHTDRSSFLVWVCRTFKDNPIKSVELGEVFISDKEVDGEFKAPAVPYRLALKDGGILEGDLYFVYHEHSNDWQAMLGIDWHLQDQPIKGGDQWTTQFKVDKGTQGCISDDLYFTGGYIDKNGHGTATVYHNYFHKDVRILAVDKNGTQHEPTNIILGRHDELAQIDASFKNLVANEVKSFYFQIRSLDMGDAEVVKVAGKS